MDPRLESIIRGLIRTGRSRRATPTARSMAQVVEGIPAGHGYRTIAVDLEAAREYESRAKEWFAIGKRAFAEADVGWTTEKARELAHILDTELVVDWEELVNLVRTRNVGRADARITELEAARDRLRVEFPHEMDLLVLAQDRNRVPVDEQLQAPRYADVLGAWRKAQALLDGVQADFPRAARESVSAVEQLARIVTGSPSATLGTAIKNLRGSGRLAAPLLKGIEEIWGWTSDTPGVRHGSAETPTVDSVAAHYIVAQSAAALLLLLATDAA